LHEEVKVQRIAYIFCQNHEETPNSLKNALDMMKYLKENARYDDDEIWFS
jgi:hypothetical protein